MSTKIKEILIKNSRAIIAVILAIIAIVSINMNMSKELNFTQSFSGNSILYIVLLVIFYTFITKILKETDKRLIICASIISILFALFEVVGYSINSYMNLSGIFENGNTIFKALIKFVGNFILIYSIIVAIFNFLSKKFIVTNTQKEGKIFNKTIKSFFIIWAIIFIAWLPYFLTYYPGLTTSDSMAEIYQAIGRNSLSNHHPVLHILLISICIGLGNLIKDYNLGVAIYSIVQMLILSSIFSFSIYYMSKRNAPRNIQIITLIFYALYPINALFSIIMWKDVLFAGIMLLFTISITEMCSNTERFLKSKYLNALFIITILLVILFRNNGLYVVALLLPFLLIAYKKYWKKILLIFVISILTTSIIKGPIFSLLNIEEGQVREALSVPMQQLARVEKYKSDSLTKNEQNLIHKYIQTDEIGTIYNPVISDPIKNHFNSQNFSENKGEFISLWVGLFFKYPVEYIESFLCNSYGYWYPEASHWVANRTVENNDIGIQNSPKFPTEFIQRIDSLIEKRDLPIISMFFSIGFAFWIIVVFFMYSIYTKKYKQLLAYIPILILWLTTLASPVFCEYRYVYSMFTCIPILVFGTLSLDFKNKENSSKYLLKKSNT